jgi:hypothetical protein
MQEDTLRLLPDYICYDAQLCNFIPPTFHYQNLTCRQREQIINTTLNYKDFLIFVKKYFHACVIPYMITHLEQYRQHPSIYCCKNSSKCILEYRLMDRVIDCHMGDDEEYELSCSLKDKYRFKCNDQSKVCWASSVDRSICTVSNQKSSLSDILFQNICDGIVNLLPQEIDGQIHNDETHCSYWPCTNIYTKCNNIKNCPDGGDEYDCVESSCPYTFFPCISAVNYTFICLPMDQFTDNIIDCFGGTDELQNCDTSLSEDTILQCSHDTACIDHSKSCDYLTYCPDSPFENTCVSIDEICYGDRDSLIEAIKLFSQLSETKNINKFFSLETAHVYPSIENNDTVMQLKKRLIRGTQSISHTRRSMSFCHYGLSLSSKLLW